MLYVTTVQDFSEQRAHTNLCVVLQLKKKIVKSSNVLEKLKNESRLAEEEPDFETISKEERVYLREMGLRIKSSLVLGKKKTSFLLFFFDYYISYADNGCGFNQYKPMIMVFDSFFVSYLR